MFGILFVNSRKFDEFKYNHTTFLMIGHMEMSILVACPCVLIWRWMIPCDPHAKDPLQVPTCPCELCFTDFVFLISTRSVKKFRLVPCAL